jgi:hypothetical protein
MQHIIIGMPPIIIIIGMPIFIIMHMRSHIAFIMSMVMPAIGIIFIIMPSAVISQVILHMGMFIIMGIGMPMLCIMPPIIGFIIIGMGIGIISFMGICIAGIMVFIL